MSHYSKKLIFGLSASALILASVAQAGEKKEKKSMPSAETMLSKLDKDQNGKLSLEEFLANAKTDTAKESLTAKFKTADADADSALSLEEYKTTMGKVKKTGKKAEAKAE